MYQPLSNAEFRAKKRGTGECDLKSEIDGIIGGRLSVTGRKWRLRDSSGYEHVDTVDGPTKIQGVLAHVRGCGRESLPGLLDSRLSLHMPDPSVLIDMDAAAARLAEVIERQEDLLVFGDYDVDGATSTAIVERYLKMAGHTSYRTVIPNREHGYGFGDAAFEDAVSGMPDVILLLDCGTQNADTIGRARDFGIDVVVIDHHKPGHGLPDANALVNPHREDQPEPGQAMRILCTAGLAFMLVAAVNRELRSRGRWRTAKEPNLSVLLDLVALGTVCDVMPLVGLNRAFVTNGLKRLDRRENVGLSALANVAGVKHGATVTSFGFHIGPRINAGGRVGTARLGADLLASDHETSCQTIAETLNTCNQERQALEKKAQAEALTMVREDDPVIVVWNPGWHEGVIGIVAGRLKEHFNRPVVVMAIREDGVVKGSGRSIDGVDLGTAIMAARDEGILVAGGGHTMACGLSAEVDKLETLREWLIARLKDDVAKARAAASTPADAALWTSDITYGFHDEIERMGPYGQGWPKPRFILGPAKATSVRATAGGHAFFDAVDDNGFVKAKAWRATESGMLKAIEGDEPVLFLGTIEIDTFRGVEEINFIVEDVMALDRTESGAHDAEMLDAF